MTWQSQSSSPSFSYPKICAFKSSSHHSNPYQLLYLCHATQLISSAALRLPDKPQTLAMARSITAAINQQASELQLTLRKPVNLSYSWLLIYRRLDNNTVCLSTSQQPSYPPHLMRNELAHCLISDAGFSEISR